MAGKKSWIDHRLTAEGRSKVEKALSEFENKFNLEIVLMIARRSSPVAQNRVTVMLLLICLFASGLFYFESFFFPLEFMLLAGGLFLLAALLSWFSIHWDLLQRFLIPDPDEIESVERRAQAEFYKHQLSHTRLRPALLVYVSVMERRAFILPDRRLLTFLPDEKCFDLVTGFSQKLAQNKDWSVAFLSLLENLQQIPGLPQAQAGQQEEIPAEFVILDEEN